MTDRAWLPRSLPPLPADATVSVIMPVRAASATLERSVTAILEQVPPVDEVVLAVAADEPATTRVARMLADEHHHVRVVDNPSGRTPDALNLAIAASGCDVIVRVDAHAVVPEGYVATAVDTLRETGAANVGGVQVPTASRGFARAVAAAMRSPVGSGGAAYRGSGDGGPADTVYLGAFRREALEAVGGFDPRFVRNQDAELNHRLREAGYLVWLEPRLRVSYLPRGRVGDLARQYWQYGRWRRFHARTHARSLRPRQMAAPALVVCLFAALGASFLLASLWPAGLALGGYGVAMLVAGAAAAERRVDAVPTAIAFVVMHLSWGVGFLIGPPSSVGQLPPPARTGMAEPDVLHDGTGTEEQPGEGRDSDRLALLRRLNERGFRLVMLLDALGLAAVIVVTMLVRFGTDWPTFAVPLYLLSFAVVTSIFVASLYFGGLYEREPRLGAPPALPRAARQTLGAGGLVALLNLLATGAVQYFGRATPRALPFPIPNLVVLIVVGALVVAGNRQLVYWMRTRREGPPKVVVVGSSNVLGSALEHLEAAQSRAQIVARLDDAEELLEAVERTGATDVLVLSAEHLDDLYPHVLEDLDRRRVTVLLRVGAKETMFGLERIREIGGLPFVVLRAQTIPVSRTRYKRLFDLTVLVLSAPVWLLLLGFVTIYQVAVVGRPLLFWQTRVGAHGRSFSMVKFRTMRPDAEADGQGARLAERDDPRVIPACRWIRSTRMDELPQLWNVLRGEMSLVGPRPERPELTERFETQIPGYTRRHEVPPGLTGLAQIHGRYHTDAEYKLGYDLQYLVNWSPVLDLEILLRTVWVVLTRRI